MATPQGFVCFTITAAAEAGPEAEALRADQLVHELPSCLGIEQVQVGELLAAVLHGALPPAGGTAAGLVERGGLMRILPITKPLGPLEDDVKARGQPFRSVAGLGRGLVQPTDDRCVINGSVRERSSRQPAARVVAHNSIGAQLVQDDPVLGGIHHHRDVRAVLRRRPDHRRTADVHHLDGGLRLERVKVADDEVDRRDVL